MYSLQHMFKVHGDPYFLDKCERIAYLLRGLHWHQFTLCFWVC